MSPKTKEMQILNRTSKITIRYSIGITASNLKSLIKNRHSPPLPLTQDSYLTGQAGKISLFTPLFDFCFAINVVPKAIKKAIAMAREEKMPKADLEISKEVLTRQYGAKTSTQAKSWAERRLKTLSLKTSAHSRATEDEEFSDPLTPQP